MGRAVWKQYFSVHTSRSGMEHRDTIFCLFKFELSSFHSLFVWSVPLPYCVFMTKKTHYFHPTVNSHPQLCIYSEFRLFIIIPWFISVLKSLIKSHFSPYEWQSIAQNFKNPFHVAYERLSTSRLSACVFCHSQMVAGIKRFRDLGCDIRHWTPSKTMWCREARKTGIPSTPAACWLQTTAGLHVGGGEIVWVVNAFQALNHVQGTLRSSGNLLHLSITGLRRGYEILTLLM